MDVPQFVATGASIFSATLFALLFICTSVGLGRRALVWLRVPAKEALAERGLASLALGAGILEFVPVALGAFNLLSVPSLRIATALLACAAIPDFTAALKRGLIVLRRPRPWIPGWLFMWTLALVPGLLVLYFNAVTPVLDPDGLGYHLTVPKFWLSAGTLSFMPMYVMSNMPMGGEMLFAIGLSFVGDAGAKLLHYSLGVAGAAALLVGGRRLNSTVGGAAAATLFLFGPFGVGNFLGSAYIEGIQGFFVVVSLITWLVWHDTRQQGWLRAAFLIGGFAISIKITSALFPAGLLFVTWFVLHRERRSSQSPLATVLDTWPLMLLVAAPVVPWLIREAVTTGNPVFPMLAKWIPSRDFPAVVATEWETYFRYMNWGNSLGPDVGLETRKLVIVVAAAAVCVVAGVAWAIVRSPAARATVIVSGLLAVMQVLAVGIYRRHWTAVMAVMQLLVIAQWAWMVPVRFFRVGAIVVTLGLSLMAARTTLGAIDNDYAGMVRTAFGLEPQRDYIARHLPIYPVFEYANQHLAADSGVLLEFSCGGFLVDRKTFCLENPQGAISVESWDSFIADARRLGVTHVIAPRWMADSTVTDYEGMIRSGPGFALRGNMDRMLIRLLRNNNRLLASASDLGLYAVDLTDLPANSQAEL